MTPTVLLAAAVAALLVALVLRANLASITVFEYERGLRYESGRFRDLLGPGRYWVWRGQTAIRKIDIRPRVVSVPGQEVLSADGIALKASLAARYRVADPVLAVNGAEDFQGALYTELQLALRAVLAGGAVETLLAERASVGPRILAAAAEPATRLGLVLESAEVKDLTLPGELKKLFTQVVKARQEGLAGLERARGETAALRNLANAAQLVERSPQLLQLRLLQVLGQQPGNTVVLGAPMASGPLPIRASQPELPPPSGDPNADA